jgi:hypothetical protein
MIEINDASHLRTTRFLKRCRCFRFGKSPQNYRVPALRRRVEGSALSNKTETA